MFVVFFCFSAPQKVCLCTSHRGQPIEPRDCKDYGFWRQTLTSKFCQPCDLQIGLQELDNLTKRDRPTKRMYASAARGHRPLRLQSEELFCGHAHRRDMSSCPTKCKIC